MTDLPALRLASQGIAAPSFKVPRDPVRALGAVQAQDYLGSLWAVGLRTKGATEDAVEQAIAEGTIVRSWPLRGTLHWVAAEDLRWMLHHLGPRVIAGIRGRYRQLELEDADFGQAGEVVGRALSGGNRLTRPNLYRLLDEAGISTQGQRGIHILQRLALGCLICFGPREGKAQTLVLADEWLPKTPEIDREEALLELALRYFAGRGPATVRDFAWWSGLSLKEARTAAGLAGHKLESFSLDGAEYLFAPRDRPAAGDSACYLLPPFDEYLVGYANRDAVLPKENAHRINNGGGLLAASIIVGGRVAGTWKRNLLPGRVEVLASPFEGLSKPEQERLALAAGGYAAFLGRDLDLSIVTSDA